MIDHRFRVLMVFTKVTARMHNFLGTVAQRSLVSGTALAAGEWVGEDTEG